MGSYVKCLISPGKAEKQKLTFLPQEKWDSLTRRWKDNRAFVEQIQLVLIDEVR
jgi:replicative superfamily II helicase